MASVSDNQIFDHICARAGIDADSSHVHAPCLGGAELVDLEDVAPLDQHDFADRAVHRSRHFGMKLELAVFTMDGNEIFRLHQVDDEFELFLAGVSAYMNGRR